MGLHRGAGVTSMSVSIANYLVAFLKKRVAVCECNGSRDFIKAKDKLVGMDWYGDNTLSFSYGGCDYYPKDAVNEMDINAENYHIVIKDFGTDGVIKDDFLRCDHKMIVSSLYPWMSKKLETFYDKADSYAGSDTWLYVLAGSHEQIKAERKKHSIYAVVRPYIENPLVIDSSLVDFFEALF